MMKKMHRFTLALASVLLMSILFTPFASARPQTKTYTVDSNAGDADANPGNGICATSGGKCTLRAAIQEANADGENTTITFAQKFQDPNDIDGCYLPTITGDYTIIDASSQWDSTLKRPGVEISSSGCTLLTIQASNTYVLGLFFGGGTNGVEISSGYFNSIGGYQTGQRNVFLTNVVGVYITGGTYSGIANNYFGTIDGASLPGGGVGQEGIQVFGGDWTTISGNLIVGQSDYGINLQTDNNTVSDNIIGMSQNKAKSLPNDVGILIWKGSNNDIGSGNVIAGNTSHGLYIYHANNNHIYGNHIGYSTGHVTGYGNGGNGIYIFNSDNIRITGSNGITFNTSSGIYAEASSGITIQGSYVDSNSQMGIYFKESSNSQIGGVGDGLRNSIGGNQGNGIQLETSSVITVTGNYIGLDAGAFDWGNQGYGILITSTLTISSTDNIIGGVEPGEANWIGWNILGGIELNGSNTYDNFVLGNVIGAPVNWGWEAPNNRHGVGIYNGAHDNWIAGGNTILASGWAGVAIVGSNSNVLMNNNIGTNGMGIDWGNSYYGVTISGSGNVIYGNEIAHNGTNGGIDSAQAGVRVDGVGAIDNMISGNSIHDNDGPGIELANNANHNLAAPVITSASCNLVQGTACANCLIEIYSDDGDEGRVYEGSLTTVPSGAFTWTGTPFGPNTTALAIGPGSSGDTSPFSAPSYAGVCQPIHIYLPLVRK